MRKVGFPGILLSHVSAFHQPDARRHLLAINYIAPELPQRPQRDWEVLPVPGSFHRPSASTLRLVQVHEQGHTTTLIGMRKTKNIPCGPLSQNCYYSLKVGNHRDTSMLSGDSKF